MATTKKPGKTPTQDRSWKMVDAILAGAARVLATSGLEQFNTNRIAEIAGVSIGSVYQFFPNKEAILQKLLAAMIEEMREKLTTFSEERGKPLDLESGIRLIVDASFDHWEKKGALASSLLQYAPKLIAFSHFERVDEKLVPLLLKKMDEEKITIGPADRETALFVVLQAARGVLSMTYSRKGEAARRKRVKEEFIRFCLAYLRP